MYYQLLPAVSCALFLVACLAAAQEAGEGAEAENLQKQIDLLTQQQNQLADEYNKILREIKLNDDLVELNRAIADAKARLAKAEAENDALAEARQGELDARDAVAKAVEQKLQEHPEGAQLLERLGELKAKRAEHLWQTALAEFQMTNPLSPVSRALAADAELVAAKLKMETASVDERSDAKEAYDALRSDKLQDIVDAQRLMAIIEDSSDAAQRMRESIVAVEERLAPIRKEIERVESKRIESAREKIAEALNSEGIVALRMEVNESVAKFNALITRLVAENEEATRLKAQYDEVRAKIKELRSKQ